MNTATPNRHPEECCICASRDLKRLCDKPPATYYLCRHCSTIFQYPQPERRQMEEYADEQYSSGEYHDYVSAREMKLAHFRRRLGEIRPFIRTGRLLDVGCSCGYFLEVAAAVGFDVAGLEFSREAIAAASPLVATRIRQATLEEIAGGSVAAYDVITAFDLIEHVPDPVSFVRNAASCLKPGGALVIATPDAGHYLQRVMGSRWPMLQPMQHLCIFSRNSLRMVLEQAHLEVRKMGVATKTITLSYLVDQLRTLNPVLYGALKAVLRLTPTAIKHRQRQVNIGEILAIAVKN